MLETQSSTDSKFSFESSTTGECLRHSSESSRGYSEGGSYQCIATLAGHSGPVASLAVVGDLIYSGGSDCSDIRIWNQPGMSEISRFGCGDGAVKAILVSGERIFSAHQDMKIRVWKSAAAGKNPKMIAALPTLKDYVVRCVSPKNYVQVRRHKRSLWIQHNDAISVLAMGAGDVLYSGSWDKSIKLWRISDFKCLESIAAHDDAVSALVTDHQGFLYSASADGSVKVWTKIGRKHFLVCTLKGHKSSSVNALVLSPDESLLYSASSDKTVCVWERTTGGEKYDMKLVGTLTGHQQAVLCIAAVGDILCTGSADKSIRIWRRSGSCHSLVASLEGHRGPVRSVCASLEVVHAGVMVYSGSIDRTVKVWWLAPFKDDDTSQGESVSPFAESPQQLIWRR